MVALIETQTQGCRDSVKSKKNETERYKRHGECLEETERVRKRRRKRSKKTKTVRDGE